MWQDIRYAWRTLAKTPGFTLVAVLTLALGIGSATSVFSVFYNLLFNAFAARDASRLAVPMAERDEPLSLPGTDVAFIRDHNHVFEDVVGYQRGLTLLSDGRQTHQLTVAGVTANAFDFYGVPALLGRPISPTDGKPDASPVFVVSYRMWKNELNGDPAVLGKTFAVAGKLHTLIGVMPPRFQAFGALTQAWVPISSITTDKLQMLARLRRGIRFSSASAEMNVLIRSIARLQPEPYPKLLPVSVISATDFLLGSYGIGAAGGSQYALKRMLYNLLAGVMLLLFIACANVGNLLLARATVRQKELAVRSALGASRARLIRQLLVESAVLSTAACALGCVFAYFGTKLAATIIPHKGLSIGGETVIGLNPLVLWFAIAAAVLTTVLCGLAPAFHRARGGELNAQIAASGWGSIGNARHARLRSGLVVGEVALSVVLLVGSGLLIHSFLKLTHVDLGFNAENLIFGAFGPSGLATYDERGSFVNRITQQLEAMPSVAEVAVNNSLPGYNTGQVSEVSALAATGIKVGFDGCTENLVSAMGLHLLRGRWLSAAEVRSAQQVAVLNKTAARDLFGDDDPVGKEITVKSIGNLKDAPFQIIGIAADTKNYNGPEQPSRPQAYIPYPIEGYGLFVIKTKAEPHSVMHAIQEQVWAVDPNVVFGHFEPVEDTLTKLTYSAPEFGVAAVTPIAGIGLLLVVCGVFSVMAYTVSLRTQEIGVRMALGAQQMNILLMVLRRGIAIIAMGAVLGTIASVWLSRFVASQLWGISAHDLLTFSTALPLIFLAGIVACYFPAQRAARTDPMVALRHE